MRISDWSSDVCSSDLDWPGRCAALYLHPMSTTTPAPARDPEVRLGQPKVLAGLLPYLWPAGRGDLKARVAVAVVSLVLAKPATVTVPLVLKPEIGRASWRARGCQYV